MSYSTVLALLASEVFLELNSDRSGFELMQAEARKEGVPFDTRTLREVIKDLKREGTEVYPNFTSEGDLIGDVYPLIGLSQTPTVFCNDLGEWVIYNTDEHGFNNPLGLWGRDPIEIMSVGDSFTWGSCVVPEQSIAGLIRNKYPNTINVGVAGTGTLKQLAIMKEYVGDSKARVVLWFYWEGNDLRGMMAEHQVPVLRRYLDGSGYSQGLIDRQAELDSLLRPMIDKQLATKPSRITLRNVVFLSLVRAKVRHLPRGVTGCKVPDETMELFERVVKEARDYVESWDGDLYFIYLPSWPRYATPDIKECPGLRDPLYSHDQVLSIASGAGLRVIDLIDPFGAHPDPLSLFAFRSHAHFTEDGYKLVVDKVLESITVPR